MAWEHFVIKLRHLTQDGAENTENCHVWDTSIPNIVHEQFLHPDYNTAKCGFLAELIFGSFLLKRTHLRVLKSVLFHLHIIMTSFSSRLFHFY